MLILATAVTLVPVVVAVAMLQRGGDYFKDLEQATILYFARDQGVDPAAAGLLSIFGVCKVQGDNSAGSHVRVYCVTVLGNSRFLQLLSRRALGRSGLIILRRTFWPAARIQGRPGLRSHLHHLGRAPSRPQVAM